MLASSCLSLEYRAYMTVFFIAYLRWLCYAEIRKGLPFNVARRLRSTLTQKAAPCPLIFGKGGRLMSTSEMLQLCLVIIGICGLFIQGKKKWLPAPWQVRRTLRLTLRADRVSATPFMVNAIKLRILLHLKKAPPTFYIFKRWGERFFRYSFNKLYLHLYPYLSEAAGNWYKFALTMHSCWHWRILTSYVTILLFCAGLSDILGFCMLFHAV